MSTVSECAGRLRRCLYYCNDVLHLDTKAADDYLSAVISQASSLIPRKHTDWIQLEKRGKWIEWNDVVKGADVLKHNFEQATDGKPKATACMKYVLYLFLTMLPPGRAEEYAKMEIVDQRHHPQQIGVNACVIGSDEQIYLHFSDYKTSRCYGMMSFNLSRNAECRKILIPVVFAYVDEWHPLIAGSSHSNMFFLRDGGAPYTPRSFSGKITAVVREATGINAGINILRKSFVTHFCGTGSTHRGLARCMRHSESMQRSVYNAVSLQEDINSGLDLAASYFSSAITSKSSSVSKRVLRAVSIERCCPPKK